jgi:hypothetical protein
MGLNNIQDEGYEIWIDGKDGTSDEYTNTTGYANSQSIGRTTIESFGSF